MTRQQLVSWVTGAAVALGSVISATYWFVGANAWSEDLESTKAEQRAEMEVQTKAITGELMQIRAAMISRQIRELSRELRLLEAERDSWSERDRETAADYETDLKFLQDELDEIRGIH